MSEHDAYWEAFERAMADHARAFREFTGQDLPPMTSRATGPWWEKTLVAISLEDLGKQWLELGPPWTFNLIGETACHMVPEWGDRQTIGQTLCGVPTIEFLSHAPSGEFCEACVDSAAKHGFTQG